MTPKTHDPAASTDPLAALSCGSGRQGERTAFKNGNEDRKGSNDGCRSRCCSTNADHGGGHVITDLDSRPSGALRNAGELSRRRGGGGVDPRGTRGRVAGGCPRTVPPATKAISTTGPRASPGSMPSPPPVRIPRRASPPPRPARRHRLQRREDRRHHQRSGCLWRSEPKSDTGAIRSGQHRDCGAQGRSAGRGRHPTPGHPAELPGRLGPRQATDPVILYGEAGAAP